MKTIILLIFIPFASIFSQNSCCAMIEKFKNQKQPFQFRLNEDSTNYSLFLVDTVTNINIYEYNYAVENPLLNIEGDFFDKMYEVGLKIRLNSIAESEYPQNINERYKFHSNFLKKYKTNSRLTRSRYTFKKFDFDTINVQLKNLIRMYDFKFCKNYFDIYVKNRHVLIRKNMLNSILRKKINMNPVHSAIVQNITEITSCESNLTIRKLDIIRLNGSQYSITEKYTKRRPKLSYSIGGISENDFDIIESNNQLLLITYVDKTINVYDLYTERLISTINSQVIIPHKFKAILLNDNAIIFIAKPVRVGGYDMKKHQGIKGNGIDYSNIKDYDDSKTQVVVLDLSDSKIYTKNYKINDIEQIKAFDEFNILFKNGKIENVKNTFYLQQ